MTTASKTPGPLRPLTTCRHCASSIWIGMLDGVEIAVNAQSEGTLSGYDERDLLIVKKEGPLICGTSPQRRLPARLEPAQSLFHQGQEAHLAHFCSGMADPAKA